LGRPLLLGASRAASADFRYATRITRAYAEWRGLSGYFIRPILDACPQELRGWEWAFLDRLLESSSTPLRGHAGMLKGVVGSPDGRRLFSAATDFTARVWDAATGHERLTFRDHADAPTEADWSRDGSRLATACEDGVIESDDIVVRAPDAAVRPQAARARVRDLFAKVKVKDEVRRQMAAGSGDQPAVEQGLAQLTEDPAGLEVAAWEAATRPGGTAEGCLLARVWAAADNTRPDSLDNGPPWPWPSCGPAALVDEPQGLVEKRTPRLEAD
jgi:hypothetical protein